MRGEAKAREQRPGPNPKSGSQSLQPKPQARRSAQRRCQGQRGVHGQCQLPGQRLLVLNGWLAERARARARAPHPHSDDSVQVVRSTKDPMSAAPIKSREHGEQQRSRRRQRAAGTCALALTRFGQNCPLGKETRIRNEWKEEVGRCDVLCPQP